MVEGAYGGTSQRARGEGPSGGDVRLWWRAAFCGGGGGGGGGGGVVRDGTEMKGHFFLLGVGESLEGWVI